MTELYPQIFTIIGYFKLFYTSAALIPECNGLSQFTEDTGLSENLIS